METTDNKQLPESEPRQQPTEEKDHDLSEKKDISEKENPQQKPVKKKKTAKDHAIRFFVKIGITALVLILTLTFVLGVYVNHTNSSYPMIKDGDLCLTFKLAKIQKGDVVAFEQDKEIKFARVIASEGETVEIKNDLVCVNGSGIPDNTVYKTTTEGSKISYPYTVPEKSIFVLNDLRSDTSDSRTLGAIPLSECKGKVIFVMRRRGI